MPQSRFLQSDPDGAQDLAAPHKPVASPEERPPSDSADGPEPRGGSPWPLGVLVALCLIGLALSIDLARIHFLAHTAPEHQSFCALSRAVSCDVVAQSRWSVVAGVPIAWWGVLGYSAMLVLSVLALARRSRRPEVPLGTLGWLSIGASALVPYLVYVSLERVRSVCIVCCGTYLVSVSLAACSLHGCRRNGGVRRVLRAPLRWLLGDRRRLAVVGLLVVGLPAGLSLAFPRYWIRPRVETVSRAGLATGIDAKGCPWIGARHPEVTLVEYSDYQCPFCRRRHMEMRRLLARYPHRLRLVHRYFPLDHHCNPRIHRRFHPHACRLAALAQCALMQGKFWEANDYLFENGRRPKVVTCQELAQAIGGDRGALCRCVRSGAAEPHVLDDIEQGLGLGVHATPTFLLDGHVYAGLIPRGTLEERLNRTPRQRSERR